MEEGEDWLMRPILEGLCKYETLFDTNFGLVDFARMNAALDVRDENQARQRRANE
jgi:hypothetical protein